MSKPPLERAARALCALDGNVADATMDGKPLWRDYLPEARAAIEAIREPTEQMVVAGDREFRSSIRFDKAAVAWRAMIAQLLGEAE